MSEMPERIWASRSPTVGKRDWWTTEKHLGWQAEYVRADRVSMTPGEVAKTRPLFVNALPGWDWNCDFHDPLFAHPFNQVVGAAIRRLLNLADEKDAEIERLRKALDQAVVGDGATFEGIELTGTVVERLVALYEVTAGLVAKYDAMQDGNISAQFVNGDFFNAREVLASIDGVK